MAPFQALRVFGMAGPIGELSNRTGASLEIHGPFSTCRLRCAVRVCHFPDDSASTLELGPAIAWSNTSPLRFFAIAARSVQSRM